MVFKDYYKTLGLNTNKVSQETIKEAYRERAKQYHPDINVGDKAAEEMFKEVNEAYKILSNEKTKRRYDFSWNRYVHRQGSDASFASKPIKNALMDIFFGTTTTEEPTKVEEEEDGEDINTKIDISIKEGFFGSKKDIVLKNIEGKDTTFSVKIPAGIQNNDKIRIVGQGKPGKNGGNNGDLFIKINIVSDKQNALKGNDIYRSLDLKPYEAALGVKKEISLFDESLSLVIPEGTSSGDEFVLKGKGYKSARGARGDLHVIAQISLDKNLDEKSKKIYEELKKADRKK